MKLNHQLILLAINILEVIVCKGITISSRRPNKGIPIKGIPIKGIPFKGIPLDIPERPMVPQMRPPRPEELVDERDIPSHTCQPNIYVAPTVNCSTYHMENQFSQLTEQVRSLQEQLRHLMDRVGSNVPGMLSSDCSELKSRGNREDGVYVVQPQPNGRPFNVYCDMETDGGGWTVFQRRVNGSENFQRSWANYRRGFGDLTGDFWLGLDKIHSLTLSDEFELRIEMQDFDNIKISSHYTLFRVDDIQNNYRLHVGEYRGLGGDSMSFHRGQPFSTQDRDNDDRIGDSCSKLCGGGGWWFKDCLSANPNGLYLGGQNQLTNQGIIWASWKGPNYSLKIIELKIRPVMDF